MYHIHQPEIVSGRLNRPEHVLNPTADRVLAPCACCRVDDMEMTEIDRRISTAAVIGGAGFIGRHLVTEMVSAGIRVTSVDRDPRGRLEGSGATSVQAEIAAGEDKLIDLLVNADLDAVFITTGTGLVPRSLESPVADLDNNVLPVLTVLEIVRRRESPPVVVYLSSAAVYGDAQVVPVSEDEPPEPLSPYGVSKLAAERYLRLYHLLYGTPTISLRPFSVFGPGQRKLVVHDLLVRFLAGEDPLTIRGVPEVTRDYVLVTDVARCAHQLALAAPACGEAFNICSGVGTSLADLVDGLRAACGSVAEIRFTGSARPGDPLRYVGDPSAGAALGASCDSDLRQGFEATADWLRLIDG